MDVAEVQHPRRVLVVEDEPAIRKPMAAYLQDAGYVVDQADHGAAALECMRASPPDVVILDLQLPGMNGPEVLEAMRAEPRLAAIPIVILSAAPGLTQASARLGARGALAKPFDLDVLLAVIDRVSQT